MKAQVCRADFYNKLTDALAQCGGAHTPQAIEEYQKMPLWKVVDILAQNGIRMVYQEESHIEKIKI